MKQGCNSELHFQHKPRRNSEPVPDRAATHLFIDGTVTVEEVEICGISFSPATVRFHYRSGLAACQGCSVASAPPTGRTQIEPRGRHVRRHAASHAVSQRFLAYLICPFPSIHPPKDFAEGAIPGESQRQMYILLLCLSACDCE